MIKYYPLAVRLTRFAAETVEVPTPLFVPSFRVPKRDPI